MQRAHAQIFDPAQLMGNTRRCARRWVKGAPEDCAESVWIVQPAGSDAALLVILQEADEISGIVSQSGGKAKNANGQGRVVEAKVSFVEHWSAQEGSEVHAGWWGVPKRFAECCLPGRGKVN